jgi:hypothetical protein
MTANLHPNVAALVASYGRDLGRLTPTLDLDARMERLVATPAREFRTPSREMTARPRRRFAPAFGRWAAAACLGTLAVAGGVIIGVRVERAGVPPMRVTHEPTWPPPDLSMWPTDSVQMQIPAEFDSRGTLVAVNGKDHNAGTRYWVNIVVSNDGTVRIENIVPVGEDHHAIDTQTP